MARWLLDIGIVGAALWTLAYHLGLLIGLPVMPLLGVWLLALLAAAVSLARWRRPVESPTAPEGSSLRPVAAAIAAVAALLAALAAARIWPLAALFPPPVLWPLAMVFAAVAAAATWAAARGSAPGTPAIDPPIHRWTEAAVLTMAAGFAALSIVIVRPDGDDVFYINRSQWVAEHGRLPVGDVLFGDGGQILPSGVPVSSFEALFGGFARLLHLPAASVMWYLVPPVVSFLAVLALWRLIRVWTPRRPLAGLLLAAVFLLWSGGSAASFGSFHLVRAWQGKAVLVSLAVPALWAYLTEWARDRSRRGYLLALCAGIAAVGFSSSATFVVPLIVAAAAIGLAIRRDYRALPWLATIAAYPVLAGLTATILAGAPAGVASTVVPARTAWLWVISVGLIGFIAAFALWCGPALARPGVPAALCWGGSIMTLVLLIPGVLETIADRTGSGPVLWRTLWLVPIPALVGLLAGQPGGALSTLVRRINPRAAARIGPRAAELLGWLPAVLLTTTLIAAAVPVWSGLNHAHLTLHPQWKTGLGSSQTADAVLRAYPHARVVLATPPVMRAIAMQTAHVKVVNPRDFYLTGLTDGTADSRRLLSDLAAGRTVPEAGRLRAALTVLRVDTACTATANRVGISALHTAGFGADLAVRTLTCLTPIPG